MPKYYAVKIGRVPGIYLNWQECQQQIKGFSGAIFKSFTTEKEAQDFITPTNGQTELPSQPELLEIYTDGSHQRQKNYLGIGAWSRYHDVEYSLSATCDSKLLAEYNIFEDTVSNPTAEFIAFTEVLKCFREAQLPATISIIFYIDYVGVKHWIDGSWQTRKPYIKKILEFCLELIKKIGNSITIVHVPGHSGNLGNDKADQLAGSLENFNEFDRLINAIKSDHR